MGGRDCIREGAHLKGEVLNYDRRLRKAEGGSGKIMI
jgi:hypothetical protein